MIPDGPRRWIFFGAFALTLLFIILRFVGLDADPPAGFRDFGSSLITDPYYYTWFARNAVLFDDWTPFDYDRYAVFRYTIVSGTAYMVFLIAGVSRFTAHLAGLLLYLGGLLMFVDVFTRKRRFLLGAVLALVLASNALLFFYSRFPLLENGMIFLAGLTVRTFFRYGHTYAGLIATGACIAATALLGKLFGAMLVVPVLAVLIRRHGRKWVMPIGLVAAGGAAATAVYLLVFFGGSVSTYLTYLDEVRATVRPAALSVPIEAVNFLLNYLAHPAFIEFATILVCLGLLGWLAAAVGPKPSDQEATRDETTFAALWFVTGMLILSPQAFRPVRHLLFLHFPLSLLAASLITSLLSGNLGIGKARGLGQWLMVTGAVVFIIVMIMIPFGLATGYVDMFRHWWWLIFLVAALVAFAHRHFARKERLAPSARLQFILGSALLLAVAAQGGVYIFDDLATARYDLRKASRDVADIVGDNAVVTGPNAPVLLIENRLRGVFDFFGPVPPPSDLIDRYGVTHLAIAPHAVDDFTRRFNLAGRTHVLSSRTIRSTPMHLMRIDQPGYRMTGYDSLVAAFEARDVDGIAQLSRELVRNHPDNLLVRRIEARAAFGSADLDRTLRVIDGLARDYPDDIDIRWFCAYMSARCYWHGSGESALKRVRYNLAAANALGPPQPYQITNIMHQARPPGAQGDGN